MTSTLTILLLDDEPLLRRATAMMLANHGGQVTTAENVDMAVALAGEQLYDVAVIDLSPPSPSAVDVLSRMRAGGLLPRRVIAVADAPIDPDEAPGFTDVICKPYPFDRLLRSIFGHGSRKRTRSGVFSRALPTARRAARAARDRG